MLSVKRLLRPLDGKSVLSQLAHENHLLTHFIMAYYPIVPEQSISSTTIYYTHFYNNNYK